MRKACLALVWCALGCGADEPGDSAAPALDAEPRAAQAREVVAEPGAGGEPDSAPPAERMVIREARLQLRAGDPRSLAPRVSAIAREAGGFVLDSRVEAVDGRAYALELSLRVPSVELDATLSRLRKLGSVLEENVTGQDVTEEFVDVSARLHAQRQLETRLLALLERSAELEDLLAAEKELARVRTEVERIEGRARYLRERSRMASIDLVACAPEQPFALAGESLGSRLSRAVQGGLELAIGVVEGAIVGAGFVVPAAALLALLLAPFWWLRRG